MMFDEIMHIAGEPGDPVGILMAASLVRDEVPWLYELAMEVYRAAKDGDVEAIQNEIRRIHRFAEIGMRGPFMEEFGFESKDGHMLAMEFPRMLERFLMRAINNKTNHVRTRRPVQKSVQNP